MTQRFRNWSTTGTTRSDYHQNRRFNREYDFEIDDDEREDGYDSFIPDYYSSYLNWF